MPLLYIHGVRQRNKPGLERLQGRFVTMMKKVSERVPAIGEDFAVRVPYWGDLAASTEYTSILPATLSGAAEKELRVIDAEQLGFDLASVPEDHLRERGRVEHPVTTAHEAVLDDSALAAEDLERLQLAARSNAATLDALIRSFAAEGLDDDEKDALDDHLARGWQALYDETQRTAERIPGASLSMNELPREITGPLRNFAGALERAAAVLALAIPPMREWVDSAHREVATFLGDTILYAQERARSATEGPITSTILRELDACTERPLIVITHSMGAAIAYDLLTRARPKLEVDCLITVGSQVGQFQNLGLFDQPALRDDHHKICGLAPRIKHWFNVCDEQDLLNFVASPVFADAVDVRFSTRRGPLQAHSGYFGQPSFYELLAKLIVHSLTR